MVEIALTTDMMSLPSPGAWIETMRSHISPNSRSRSLHRERGLKHQYQSRHPSLRPVAPFTGSVD